ncbi:hypothetical protein BWI96_20140 [Siphonobacter sp. SORGH_AS_0500]|nr:hypothetical protein BWI96_20140 [Siphonobacter sp. SORGH_AS_0500]
MRPHDIAILLKIVLLSNENKPWQYRDLSVALDISLSEISQSLRRSAFSGLYQEDRKKVFRQRLYEFLQFGLPYTFPVNPGSLVTGIKTAHSHPYFREKLISSQELVWPYEDGDTRGQAIKPLYPGVPAAIQKDEIFYKMLASIDILRVGQAREILIAKEELEKSIL